MGVSQDEIVARAESYLRTHTSSPVSVSGLAIVVGRSERALRNAFHRVRGMSPKRYMRLARLQQVRRALRGAGNRHVTVTSVATEFGFYELGRFAADYRRAFGEVPSETLRRVAGPSLSNGGSAHEHAGTSESDQLCG